MQKPFEGLYIHIPFCVQRCAYCDFATNAVPQDSPQIDEYVEKVVDSVDLAGQAGLLDGLRTVYIGGGTPSYLGSNRLKTLLEGIARNVDLDSIEEYTMEANPDSFTDEVARTASELGVNRFSIGVQSLDSMVLKILGRVHTSMDALQAINVAMRYGKNVSADVICGVMGDHAAAMQGTLAYLKRQGVQHVSVYPLTLEEGTPLQQKVAAGRLLDVDEDGQADEMEAARRSLTGDGYEHYEVSNYALPGRYSRHNTSYWTGAPYLGLGNGAASMFCGCDEDEVRASGVLQPWGWEPGAGGASSHAVASSDDGGIGAAVAYATEGPEPDAGANPGGSRGACARVRVTTGPSSSYAPQQDPFSEERLTASEAAAEDFMLAMRTVWGVSQERYDELCKDNPALVDAAKEVQDKGLARWEDGSFVPTQRGWLLGNELYGAIWAKSEYPDRPF